MIRYPMIPLRVMHATPVPPDVVLSNPTLTLTSMYTLVLDLVVTYVDLSLSL